MTNPLTVEVATFASTDVPDLLTDDRIADLVGFALESESATGAWEINISFVDSDEIQRLHEQFMAIPEPTDILTFGLEGGHGGDIAICVPEAQEYAAEHEISPERELCFLVVHGVLHLLGHDDHDEEMRSAMLSRQDQILDQWGQLSR